MKTLILYDSNGSIIFALGNPNTDYKILLTDIPKDKVVSKIIEDKPVFDDTEEVKKRKKELEAKKLRLHKEQIENEAELVEISYKKILLNMGVDI